jgi:hypothetical protein
MIVRHSASRIQSAAARAGALAGCAGDLGDRPNLLGFNTWRNFRRVFGLAPAGLLAPMVPAP